MQNPERLHPDRPDQPVVLIVEDDVSLQNSVRVVLEHEGYFVLTAESAEDALLLSRKTSFDIHLLLSDVQMHKMNGIDLARIVVKERPGVSVLLMSACPDEHCHGYNLLQKPFARTRLIETIRGLIHLPMKAKAMG